MSITRVGSTKKFADGWDGIFSGSRGKSTAGMPTKKKAAGKKAIAKAVKKSAKKKPAKSVAPAPPGGIKKKSKRRPAIGANQGPGDGAAKKSAAKRTSKTRTKRPQPALAQRELF